MGNIYSTIPYDAGINKLALTLNCSTPGLQASPLFQISTTSPLTAGVGQDIYYADVVGALTLLEPFITLGEGYASWQVDLTTRLFVNNASPQTALITQSVRNEIHDLVFNFAADGANPSIGPFVAGSAGTNDLQLGQVDFGLTFYTGDGVASGPSNFTCLADTPAKIISSVAVDSSARGSGIVSNGGGDRSSLPSGLKSARANIPVDCSLFRPTAYPDFNFSIAAIAPDTVTAGATFNLTNVIAFLTLPPAVTYGLAAGTGASPDPVDIQLVLGTGYGLSPAEDGLILNVMNAQPSSYDAARTDPESQTRPGALLRSQRLVSQNASVALPMPLPVGGSLSLGPFIAGSAGSVVSFSVSRLNGYLASNTGAQVDLTCQLDNVVNLFRYVPDKACLSSQADVKMQYSSRLNDPGGSSDVIASSRVGARTSEVPGLPRSLIYAWRAPQVVASFSLVPPLTSSQMQLVMRLCGKEHEKTQIRHLSTYTRTEAGLAPSSYTRQVVVTYTGNLACLSELFRV